MTGRTTVVPSSKTSLEASILGIVAEFSGEVGVCALHARSGESLLVNAERSFPAASVVKLFVLVALYQASVDGSVELEDRLQVTGQDHCLGSGVLAHLSDPVSLTLRDLATLMMMVSDNTAANLLIDRLGASRVRRTIERAGLERTRFGGPIDFSALRNDKAALGESSPLDMARFMMKLYRGELLPPELTARAMDTLRVQKYVEPMRRLLPVDPYAKEFGEDQAVSVASKTGSLDGVRVEVGFVETRAPGGAWALSVMTARGADTRVTSDNEAVLLIARVSRAVFDAWSG